MMTAIVHGAHRADFTPVATEFARNFAERGEVGASLCVIVDGATVLDLWGGLADPATGTAWERDTVGVVFSCTKAAVALCVHLLIAAGDLDGDTEIHRIWPEFAANGKADITIDMALSHTAGIPVLTEPLGSDALEDWAHMIGLIEAQPPLWSPGSAQGYHPLTFGHILGEVVRRASGQSLGQFFAAEVAGPRGLDFWIGLPESVEPRVAPILPTPRDRITPTPFLAAATGERGSIPNQFLFNSGDWARTGVNTRAGRAAEIPAANGVTNARGLAGLYAAIGEARIEIADAPPTFDQTLLMPTRFSQGFMRPMDQRAALGEGHSLALGPRAFGHSGTGGSVGFLDPEHRLAVGYTMNQLGPGVLLGDRGQHLVDSIYRALAH